VVSVRTRRYEGRTLGVKAALSGGGPQWLRTRPRRPTLLKELEEGLRYPAIGHALLDKPQSGANGSAPVVFNWRAMQPTAPAPQMRIATTTFAALLVLCAFSAQAQRELSKSVASELPRDTARKLVADSGGLPRPVMGYKGRLTWRRSDGAERTVRTQCDPASGFMSCSAETASSPGGSGLLTRTKKLTAFGGLLTVSYDYYSDGKSLYSTTRLMDFSPEQQGELSSPPDRFDFRYSYTYVQDVSDKERAEEQNSFVSCSKGQEAALGAKHRDFGPAFIYRCEHGFNTEQMYYFPRGGVFIPAYFFNHNLWVSIFGTAEFSTVSLYWSK
jgi:hypothetical protein